VWGWDVARFCEHLGSPGHMGWGWVRGGEGGEGERGQDAHTLNKKQVGGPRGRAAAGMERKGEETKEKENACNKRAFSAFQESR